MLLLMVDDALDRGVRERRWLRTDERDCQVLLALSAIRQKNRWGPYGGDSRRRARRDILHADCIDVGGSWTSGYEARSALALDAAAVYLIALSTLALIVRNIPRLKLVWMVPRGCWEGMRTVSFRVTYSS